MPIPVPRSRRGAVRRVTLGAVAAVAGGFRGPRSRPIPGACEPPAPLARGASGGRVVTATGALLGINTHRLGEGFYLAMPADTTLRERIDQLASGQAPRHRQLGVALAAPHVARRLRAAVGLPERDGLLVQQVFDETLSTTIGAEADLGDWRLTAYYQTGTNERFFEGVQPILEERGSDAAKSDLVFPDEEFTADCFTQTDPPGNAEEVAEVEQEFQSVITG